MPAWLTIIADALGLTDFIAKWIKQKEDEKTGAQLHQNADLQAQVKQAVDARKDAEAVHRLSDDDLNQQLRDDGAGH